jgi:hypothetical protein
MGQLLRPPRGESPNRILHYYGGVSVSFYNTAMTDDLLRRYSSRMPSRDSADRKVPAVPAPVDCLMSHGNASGYRDS